MNKRINKLQKRLAKEKLDALLVSNSVNIRYLTGFVGMTAGERESYVVVTKKSVYFLTSKLNSQWLTGELVDWLTGLEISYEKKMAKRLFEIAKKENLKRIAFEENDLTVGENKNLKLKMKNEKFKIQLVPTKNLVEKLRMIKDESEIKAIKKAAKLTDKAFEYIVKFIKARTSPRCTSELRGANKLSEKQLVWEIEKFIKERGAELAFSPIVAFGKNSAIPHYKPTMNHELQTMNLILIDLGAKVSGYCADMTRIIFIGKPTEKQKRVYNTVLRAQKKALDYLASSPGLERGWFGKKADEIARSVIEKEKLPLYSHSLGHGVGLEIHEGFRLSVKKDFTLKPCNVFSVEPGVYIPNWGGIRIEDLVLLTNNGLEILSKTTKGTITL